MVKRSRHHSAGFTLMEAVMVAAIVGGVVALATPFMTQSVRFYVLSRAKMELQREARANLALISRFIREGQSSTILIDRATGQPPFSRIRFTRNTPTGTQQITFYQNGTQLILISGATHTQILSSNLRYLAFAFPRSDDMGIISVATTLEKSIYQGQMKALHMASEKVRVMNQ